MFRPRKKKCGSGYRDPIIIHLSNVHPPPGERPYKCHIPDCGRAFIQLSNLQQHLRNHESQIERLKNRPFHCNICGKGFATESSLRTHTGKVSAAPSSGWRARNVGTVQNVDVGRGRKFNSDDNQTFVCFRVCFICC